MFVQSIGEMLQGKFVFSQSSFSRHHQLVFHRYNVCDDGDQLYVAHIGCHMVELVLDLVNLVEQVYWVLTFCQLQSV